MPDAQPITMLEPETDGEFMIDPVNALAKHRGGPDGSVALPWVVRPGQYYVGGVREDGVGGFAMVAEIA